LVLLPPLLATASATDTYTLSLHDALPIFGQVTAAPLRIVMKSRRFIRSPRRRSRVASMGWLDPVPWPSCDLSEAQTSSAARSARDRKSTRLNSSHQIISYAVFCLKKKKTE